MAGLRWLMTVVMMLGVSVGRAQLPAGTREADDTSREDAANARINDAEASLEKQDYVGAAVKLKSLAAERPITMLAFDSVKCCLMPPGRFRTNRSAIAPPVGIWRVALYCSTSLAASRERGGAACGLLPLGGGRPVKCRAL